MSSSVVYLFVDTNLLLQCRPLEELDWSVWKEFDEVRLIVSSSVLREIDYRKNKGNDRVGNRARATSAMFREILNDEYKLVHDSGPCVKLSVEPQHRHSEALEERLNYQERDDQLIGTVYEFAKSNPGTEVHLLTHDTTPLYTARGFGLVADVIPDEWLLPPENTESEKELAALKTENTRLKKAEPYFTIQCLHGAGAEIKCYKDSFTWFEPLTDAETNVLLQHLKECFPLETDFGSRESAERDVALFGTHVRAIKRDFTPATDEEIAKYRDEAYPQWLERCEEVLSNYHRTLQRQMSVPPPFVFLVENRGTRPAADALITIEAKGDFQIKPPPRDEGDEDDSSDEGEDLQKKPTALLPSPPSAPCGRWQTTIGGRAQNLLSLSDALPRSLAGINRLTASHRGQLGVDPSLLHTSYLPQSHDPNEFYYKPDRPQMPQDAFCLECDQWRHEDGRKDFHGEIHFPTDLDAVEGALVCRIQAGNLSKSVSKQIPVRITTARVSTFERAHALVKKLAGRPKFRIEQASGQSGSPRPG